MTSHAQQIAAFPCKVDMHVHSKFSDRPSEWILRRVGAPECFTDPETLYQRAKAAGMKFVTISDHNEIRGALELKAAHPQDVFIAQEITTYFPENGCKIHVLAWDFTEQQHREIQDVRKDIKDLIPYLRQQSILHSLAHPFYQNNKKLTLDQFEKMILMFKHFEGLNGSRDALLSSLGVEILQGLTPDVITHLADRHGIAPMVEEPHIKFFTGGSDDHSSVFIARAYTRAPEVKTYKDYLQAVRQGKCTYDGKPGTALTLSHSLYNIAYLYYSDKLKRGSKSGHELMTKIFENFVAGENPTIFSFGDKMRHAANKVTAKKKTPEEQDLSLSAQFSKLFKEESFKDEMAGEIANNEEVEVRSFKIATRIVNKLSYIFFEKLVQKFADGNILDCLQAVSALGPIALGAAPYLVAFKHYTKDRKLMEEASLKFLGRLPPEYCSQKRAWFTDTFQDVNGVAHTIHKFGEVAQQQGKSLKIITCKSKLNATNYPVQNFLPIGEFNLKEYDGLHLAFPSILEIIEHCWRENYEELIISTPGPVGLAGLAAAKLLGIKVSGIYHTDFPQYVRMLADDENMGSMTWKYMEWFYGMMDIVYVPSESYRLMLLDHGISAEKLKIMPRGINIQDFSPEKRDSQFWEMYGANGQTKFLYAGRISKEKDLDTLVEAYIKLYEKHPETLLALVGDGPYLAEVKKRLPKASCIFTGFLSGEALAKAYASSDVFVFPSTTDTFGNVILEAQSSGLPTIVSDKGGPRELVKHGETGLIVHSKDSNSLLWAMERFVQEKSLRQQMGTAARNQMSQRTWEKVFKDFWG